MTEFYEKECPIDGSQEPVSWGHLGIEAKVPEKCRACEFFFEGKCKQIRNRLVRLDYGFCGVEGSKELVEDSRAKRKIPKKCSECQFLKEHDVLGLVCSKDEEIWGEMPRGLDY